MQRTPRFLLTAVLAALHLGVGIASGASAAPLPGGTLDPAAVPKYVIPLVIPPVMNDTIPGNGVQDRYEIAVRQFKQQILPGGIWNLLNGRSDGFAPTTVWSYGPAQDQAPDATLLGAPFDALDPGVAPAANSQFNYPAYTIETISNVPVGVRWINDLKPNFGAGPGFLPHLLPIDQTLHWANPPQRCAMAPSRTDCMGDDPTPYTGPVPIVTHVHGAHVDAHSDGYPEAWWLPALNDGLPEGYASHGRLFDDVNGNAVNPGNLGYADFFYRQDQPATTLWYHDHSLGMTRANVYAGPAGFWLIRGGGFDAAKDTSTGKKAVFPGPAPVAGQTVLQLNVPGDPVRNGIREIPIVIQDRSFDAGGASLFYPDNRAFFEVLNVPGEPQQFPGAGELQIGFVPDSDIAPIWNPEAFFNVMVVNGVSWPTLEVAQARYRFRFLNGCNSRFLWLKFGDPAVKVYQIGAEQGFLSAPVDMNALDLDGTGDGRAQILMALAERADAIVDFSGLSHGTEVLLLNIGPDEPFGGGKPCPAGRNPIDNPGCGDFAAADPATTGQVMKFVVNSAMNRASPTDPAGVTPATNPANLALKAEKPLDNKNVKATRQISLNEGVSQAVCVRVLEDGTIQRIESVLPGPNFETDCSNAGGEPFGPKVAHLGKVDLAGAGPAGIPLAWNDESGISLPVTVFKVDGTPVVVNVTENPALGSTEVWEMYNFTEDAHPIHLHLVRFQVVDREGADGVVRPPEPWETGYKDTVIAYPGEITRVTAKFDIPGLYVWHCHIVEHEDNEMMRPYVVSP